MKVDDASTAALSLTTPVLFDVSGCSASTKLMLESSAGIVFDTPKVPPPPIALLSRSISLSGLGASFAADSDKSDADEIDCMDILFWVTLGLICPYLSLSLVDGGWAMGDGSDSTTSTCVIDGPNGPRDRNFRDTASTPMCFMILMHSPSEHVPKGFLMISIFDRDMANQSSGRTDRQLRNRWTLGVPK